MRFASSASSIAAEVLQSRTLNPPAGQNLLAMKASRIREVESERDHGWGALHPSSDFERAALQVAGLCP